MAKLKVIIIFLSAFLGLTACGQNEKISKGAEETDNDTENAILDGNTVDKISQCLEEQVPEICDWEVFVEKKSENKAYLYERFDGRIEDVYKNGEGSEYLGKYYSVYVGEMWEDHSVNWAWFYVSVDFNEVLWKDVLMLKGSEFEVYTLEEWRNSPWYPQLDEEK
ncbi:MAG: hypothetical protein HDQ96_05145 [Lachnospiraceae bacterium]|nr:hypothetical protein [Lachnospiraceae bacterium]